VGPRLSAVSTPSPQPLSLSTGEREQYSSVSPLSTGEREQYEGLFMDLGMWLPILFVLGLATLGLMFAFVQGCETYREPAMIVLTAIVTALLFVYLLAALLRPEWF